MSRMAQRMAGIGPSVFYEMTRLANEHHAVNLGQGFPDFPCPDFLKEAAIGAIRADVNQYAPSTGRPGLREKIAAKVQRQYGMEVDPASGILVTHGATEAIFAAILGLAGPGDEVVVFEPTYDSYVPSIEMAGAVPRYCTMRPPDWRVDPDELASLFNSKTRLLVLNTPHNPTGKMYRDEELELIASLCRDHDVVAVSDEVYEHIVFDGARHRPLATLPGMSDRTVTISSLGKTFSVTGWKVGWVLGAPDLIEAVFRGHQFIVFAGVAPTQAAAEVALSVGEDYYSGLAAEYTERRDYLLGALTRSGLKPITPQGSYFILVDIAGLPFAGDVAFCRYLTTEIGVASIPCSAFYHNPADGANLVRFAFCKSRSTLEAAAGRLSRLKKE
jgi:N-succinyldiaminopimelate aminotransferase